MKEGDLRMNTVLETNQVSKSYDSKATQYVALQNIDLQVKEGEFVGIMGPSGAGKTTLLNIVSTIDTPTSGTVMIDGENIVDMNEDQLALFRREKLGFIFQDYNLLDSLTVKENIALPLALQKKNVKEIEARVKEIAEKFGIDMILSKYPYQISGGQKQRCAAARAIVTKPSVIFGDEPTGALDSKSATDLLESLKALNENDQATIMLVTHDAFAASFCQRIIFIKDGKLDREIVKGENTRKVFFQQILDCLAELGGVGDDAY